VSFFICYEGDEVMNDFKEQLQKWKQDHIAARKHGQKEPKKKSGEVITDADIRSLMGMNRARYGRKRGGAIRQK
jgi:hypothetical protein